MLIINSWLINFSKCFIMLLIFMCYSGFILKRGSQFLNKKVYKSWYIAWFVVSRSIKKLFLIVSIFIFSHCFFNRFYPVEMCGANSHCLYDDSLHLRKIKTCIKMYAIKIYFSPWSFYYSILFVSPDGFCSNF